MIYEFHPEADLRKLMLARFPYFLIYSSTSGLLGLSQWLMRIVAQVTGDLESHANKWAWFDGLTTNGI